MSYLPRTSNDQHFYVGTSLYRVHSRSVLFNNTFSSLYQPFANKPLPFIGQISAKLVFPFRVCLLTNVALLLYDGVVLNLFSYLQCRRSSIIRGKRPSYFLHQNFLQTSLMQLIAFCPCSILGPLALRDREGAYRLLRRLLGKRCCGRGVRSGGIPATLYR